MTFGSLCTIHSPVLLLLTRDGMLSSFARDRARSTDGQDAFFLVQGFPEFLSHAVALHFLENLNVYTTEARQ